jgi:hyperosmotically inducible protein
LKENKDWEKRKVEEMSKIKNVFAVGIAGLVIALAPQVLLARTGTAGEAASSVAKSSPADGQLGKQVRQKLLRLPYYGVFDDLSYSIDGGTVTLHGQVVHASTRSDAERSVARIPGVTQVVNKIQVLPLSGFDDSIRVNTYRALQRTAGLYRYFLGTNPSLHIVVDRGHVTLTGVVSNKMDKQLAYITASGVPGTFSVTNNLQVESESRAR